MTPDDWTGPSHSATLAVMATAPTSSAREQLRGLVKTDPDLTATEAGRRLGVSRQRVQALADEEGITLSRYVRGSTPLRELSGTVAKAKRTVQQLRALLAVAKAVERTLTKSLDQIERATNGLPR